MNKPPSEFQEKCIAMIRDHSLNGSTSTGELAIRLKTSRLAISAEMRGLEKRGLAGYFRSGEDQWSAQMWFIRQKPLAVPPETAP